MTTNRVSPADALSRFPNIGPYASLPFSSTKQRNRKWRMNRDNWLLEDISTPYVSARSSSASSVPLLNRQIRDILPDAEHVQYRGPTSSRSVSYFSGTYKEDTSAYIQQNSKPQYISASAIRSPQSHLQSPLVTNETHPKVFELNVDTCMQDIYPRSEPRPRRPRHLETSSKSFPITELRKTITLTVTRKPVASSVPNTPGAAVIMESPTYDILRPSFLSFGEVDIKNKMNEQGEKESPKSPFESIWDQTPPPTPSPPPRALPRMASMSMRKLSGAPENASLTTQLAVDIAHPQSTIVSSTSTTSTAPTSISSFRTTMDPLPHLLPVLRQIYTSLATLHYETSRSMALLLAKLLFVLYLAACIWNVIIAIQAAVVKAFEPFIYVFGVVWWVFGW